MAIKLKNFGSYLNVSYRNFVKCGKNFPKTFIFWRLDGTIKYKNYVQLAL